jgi:type IV secretory pathway TrbD component
LVAIFGDAALLAVLVWLVRMFGFVVWLVSARFVLLPHPDPSFSVTVSGVCQGGKDALTNPRNR